MKAVLAPLTALLLLTAPAFADGKVYVQLPDMTSFEGKEAEDLLYQLVVANVVSSNCPGYEITDAEWSLLTDAADLVAYGQLKIDAGKYDDEYYNPAFDLLDEAPTCEAEGPAVQPILDELVALGGSREPLPDQEAAYLEWRTLMDRLQEEAQAAEPAETPRKTKTK